MSEHGVDLGGDVDALCRMDRFDLFLRRLAEREHGPEKVLAIERRALDVDLPYAIGVEFSGSGKARNDIEREVRERKLADLALLVHRQEAVDGDVVADDPEIAEPDLC